MATFNGAALRVSLFAHLREQQMVALPLMVPFAVIVSAVLGQDPRQRPLAEQDYFGQAFLFDRTNPTFPEVHSAVYVSEDSALARARAELVEFRDVLQELERNPLPASIEVKLKPQYRDAEHVRDVAERLGGFGFVDDVRFGRDWVEKLDRLRQIAAAVGLVVGAAFAVVAIIIIGTTIRMAVLQRGREIAIMRLVGATNGFIRRPFLLQGAIKGMLGGLVAVGLSYGAYALINRWLIQAAFFSNLQALAIVGFGTLIGLFGSAASVGRHLRRV